MSAGWGRREEEDGWGGTVPEDTTPPVWNKTGMTVIYIMPGTLSIENYVY